MIVAQSLFDAGPPLLLGVIGIVALVALIWELHRRRALREGLERLLERDGLRSSATPCGWSPSDLAGLAPTPRGDRRFGLRHGVTGPLTLSNLGGQDVEVECAAFEWWYEQRRRSTNQHGTQTRYSRRTTVVTAVALPHTVDDDIRLTSESVLGHLGLTRGGHQLESSEFNRRFRVEATDRRLTVQLLDAHLQRLLLEEFRGRTIQLRGSLLLIGGTPSHRDRSLPAVIGQLPAVRQDAARVLSAIPAQFWRATASRTLDDGS